MDTASLAAVMTAPRRTEFREIPLPEIPEDAGLLRVAATGICANDWPKYLSESFAPSILGHEIVGHVVKLGRIARAHWRVAEGDYVAVEEYLPCGRCAFCRAGEHRSCAKTDIRKPGALRYGATRLDVLPALYGGCSRYLYLHPLSLLHPLPETLPPRLAALALPLADGVQWAAMEGGAGPGKTVLILGAGRQGLACAAAASDAGADRIVIAGLARHRDRLERATHWGATHAFAIDETDARAFIGDLTGGAMADLVIDTSDAGPEIINGALSLLRKHGRLLCASPKNRAAPFDLDRIIGNRISVIGAQGHSFAAVERAIGLLNSGKIPLSLLSGPAMGLTEVDRALTIAGGEAAEEAPHIAIEPWR